MLSAALARSRRWNTDLFVNSCQAEWHALRIERAKNDLEIAELARKIRNVIRKALSDHSDKEVDELFMEFIRTHLDGCRSDVMLRRAYSFDVFKPADWARFSGWPGITFLMTLSAAQRERLMEALPSTGHHTVRAMKAMAKKLGIEAPPSGIGRPTKAQTTKRLATITAWAERIYSLHPNLPPPPMNVLAALPRGAQAKIMAVKSARA